jgi:hypothetical protein
VFGNPDSSPPPVENNDTFSRRSAHSFLSHLNAKNRQREREKENVFSLRLSGWGGRRERKNRWTVGGFRFLPFLQLAATSMSLLYKLKFKYILPPYTTTDWKKKKKEGILLLFYFWRVLRDAAPPSLARPTPPHSPVNRVRVVGRTNAESSKG